VQPRVNPGGLVYMNISQQVSQVDPTVASVNGNPSISQRQLATQVAVQSGQTVLLGGLIQQQEGATDTGIPGLNSIPVLGRLFGTTSRNRNRTELIVLITPRVIGSSDEAKQVTDEYQRKFESLAPLHAANAAAVENIVAAIESQVERLLPEGTAKNTRTRIVGEIYRELDGTLRASPQFATQLRDAFRSGSLDDAHQRAVVSLLASRARQALPAVAKQVLGEWTSALVNASTQRRARQRQAEGRVDIAGSGGGANDGRRTMSPRDLDYSRLTDADILNL